jgi:hypothetical protein
MDLPKEIIDATKMASIWVKDKVDDWVIVKLEIMGELDNEHRMLFSKRDGLTKELPAFNELELAIVQLWKTLTGVELILRPLKDRRGTIWWTPNVAKTRKRGKNHLPKKK